MVSAASLALTLSI